MYTPFSTNQYMFQGRELWVMVVSSSPYEHMIGKPNVKYVANMHGNEAIGRELMLHLILYLVQNYDTDYYVRWLLDNTRIHVMPSMNPDGFEVSMFLIPWIFCYRSIT